MTDQDPPIYDFDLAIRTIREKMDAPDVTTVATKCIAEGFTKVMRGNLGADELVAACRSLIMSGGTLGHLSNRLEVLGVNANSINLILNIQSVAAVMILDDLELERLEAELEAGS